jgi:hypothetical protein
MNRAQFRQQALQGSPVPTTRQAFRSQALGNTSLQRTLGVDTEAMGRLADLRTPKSNLLNRQFTDNVLRQEPNKKTLQELIAGFFQVFVNWKFNVNSRNIALRNTSITGQDTLQLNVRAHIRSNEDRNKIYKSHIRLRRNDIKKKWSRNMPCEVHCTCPAFRFWMAHPDYRTDNFWSSRADADNWNRVENQVKNPTLIPGICKHLLYLSDNLVRSGVIN